MIELDDFVITKSGIKGRVLLLFENKALLAIPRGIGHFFLEDLTKVEE